ncbi:MAG: hypothetical protein Ct9H300mP14_14380 [Gammaproteobacteria bacterium]|nr:MAG: hypothetical protein Ct9H300mP14_14380 [Gammaproteobacteria bacterium]
MTPPGLSFVAQEKGQSQHMRLRVCGLVIGTGPPGRVTCIRKNTVGHLRNNVVWFSRCHRSIVGRRTRQGDNAAPLLAEAVRSAVAVWWRRRVFEFKLLNLRPCEFGDDGTGSKHMIHSHFDNIVKSTAVWCLVWGKGDLKGKALRIAQWAVSPMMLGRWRD